MNAVRMPADFLPMQSNARLATNRTSSSSSSAFEYVIACGSKAFASATKITRLCPRV